MSDGKNGEDTRSRVRKAKEVFDKYGEEIRAIIEFNVRDKLKTEDFFQDLFVSVVKNPIPPEIDDVRAYIFKAVANDTVDSIRRAGIHREGVRIYAEYHKDNQVQEEPQNVVIKAEEVERMFRLIEDHLPPRYAQAMLQCYGDGRKAPCTQPGQKVKKRSVSRYLSEGIRKMRKLVLEKKGATE